MCGRVVQVRQKHLRADGKGASVVHGDGRKGARTPTYITWASMICRCTNPNARAFKWYGARGITVCDRWRSYANFLADMGPRPAPGLSLDRVNNDGNYEPGNCRWATWKEQAANKRPRQRARQSLAEAGA